MPRLTAASQRSIKFYNSSAKKVSALYESTSFDAVHAGVLDLLPKKGSRVLDIGAGSGRDAAALAKRGFRVTAVEPAEELRRSASLRHLSPSIEWIDDTLPRLAKIGDRQFDFILVSAVWMHLAAKDRTSAMQRLFDLAKKGRRVVITIREGAADVTRSIYRIDVNDVAAAATGAGFRVVRSLTDRDALGRAELSWSTLVLSKPYR